LTSSANPSLPLKGNRKYIVVLLLTLALAIYAEMSSPRPIDWSESFSRYHRRPYGAFVLYELLVEQFTGGDLQTTDRPIYNTLDDYFESEHTTYVVVNSDFYPDELDRDALLQFLDGGNSLFLSTGRIDQELADTLGINLEEQWLEGQTLEEFFLRDTIGMNLVAPSLRGRQDYPLRVGRSGERWLTSFDTSRSVVLGRDEKGRTNFIRIEQGGGDVYLHTAPVAFVNHNVLVGRNAEYAFGALSYVPRGNVIWDEHYKAGRERNDSPFSVIMRETALSWVWILTIAGVTLFILVHARRRQRAIPVVAPPANTTIEFATTVGRLYYEHGDHRGIAAKKIAYFNEYLRSHLGLRPGEHDPGFHRRVAERSGIPEERILSLFGRINHVQRTREFDEHDLKGLNADLEDFYTNTKR
jgi:hypothetical protein